MVIRDREEEKQSAFRITAVRDFSEAEQILRRKVHLKYDQNNYPYYRSRISFERMPIADLYPTAYYVLNEGLALMQQLALDFQHEGIDIFQMKPEAAHIYYILGENDASISPPVVEISQDDDNKPLIVDGLHRIFLARARGERTIPVIRIENTSCPVAAYPLSWEEVVPTATLPALKRRYRINSVEELRDWARNNWERYQQGYMIPPDMLQRLLDAHQG